MKKVILNVGHGGVKKDPGACGNGFEEHAWNRDFVNNYIVPECKEQGIDYVVVYQDYYSKLPDKINNLANKGDITLSFHLNAADETAHGAEMLYWHSSKKSKELAEFLQEANIEATHLKDRKILPRDYADRGATLLRKNFNALCHSRKRIHNKFRRYESVRSNKKGTGKILRSSSKELLEE